MELCLEILLSLFSLATVIAGKCPENCAIDTCSDEDSGCPNCTVAYWGRRCQYTMECLSSSTGVEYRGKKNTTKTGIACQPWSSQNPHEHTNTHFPSNYCRHKGENPNVPWCYTMDKDKRSESCDIEQCSKYCKRPDFNAGYDVVSPPSNGFTPGLVLDLIIRCEDGYTVPEESSITCQNSSMKWTPWPKCQRVECQKPGVENGVVPIKVEYLYNDTIQIECNTGYEIEGNSATLCQANKTWTSLPTCQAVKCPVPSLNNHSFIVNDTDGQTFIYEDVIAVSCETGYVIKGQSSLVCSANREWNDTLPTCMIQTCQKPDLSGKNMYINSPQEEYVYEDVITVSCESGAVMSSNDTYVCQENGTWGREFQACKRTKESESKSQSESNTGVVIGSIFAVLIVVGIFAAIFILMRMGRLNKDCIRLKKNENLSVSLEELEKDSKGPESVDNAYVNDDGDVTGNKGISDKDGTSNAAILDEDEVYSNENEPKETKVKDIWLYLEDKLSQTGFFARQFETLGKGLQRKTDTATMPKNKTKNKYKNIYPYDDNIVRLSDSSYINASPIKGYHGKKYIAAQGPINTTVMDFWKMVWECNTGKIIMLTNIFEDGYTKCVQYWSETGKRKEGQIIIEVINTDEYSDFTIKQISISKGKTSRLVHHFHFKSWPDKSVPINPVPLVLFHRKMDLVQGLTQGPPIIHCSAGIGRTGTFIALDYLLDQAKSDGSVDVYSCVEVLRQQRVNMVQTIEQYIFLHRLLAESLQVRQQTVQAYNFSTFYQHLLSLNPATRKPYLEEEFHVLNKTTPNIDFGEFKSGKQPENKDKSRYCNTLPVDCHRPYLVRTPKTDNETDFINASYLPDYMNNKAFIVTQMPLPNTTSDFICLLVEQNVSVVIMLNQSTDEKSCGKYIPEDQETLQVGTYSIVLLDKEVDGELLIRRLKITTEKINTIILHVFVKFWADDVSVPDSPVKVVSLVQKIQQLRLGRPTAPVVVHCMNGVDKSGLLCTVAAIIERLKVEQEVVIQQIIKLIRSRRPHIIPNMEQFKFCYDAVEIFLEEFNSYGNFS